jgi:hypothetical protein
MPEPVSPLMIQFLTWVSSRPRTYAEAMEAWRSSCPRHTAWEDALLDGLIRVEGGGTLRQSEVTLTPLGRSIIDGDASRDATQIDPASGPTSLIE